MEEGHPKFEDTGREYSAAIARDRFLRRASKVERQILIELAGSPLTEFKKAAGEEKRFISAHDLPVHEPRRNDGRQYK